MRGPSTIYIRSPSPIVLGARGCVKKYLIGCEMSTILTLQSRFCRIELGSTLNSKMVSEPPPQSAEPHAIKFLIGPFTIYIRASNPIALGARECVKKFHIGYEMTCIYTGSISAIKGAT
jgi:hypothetical protein